MFPHTVAVHDARLARQRHAEILSISFTRQVGGSPGRRGCGAAAVAGLMLVHVRESSGRRSDDLRLTQACMHDHADKICTGAQPWQLAKVADSTAKDRC